MTSAMNGQDDAEMMLADRELPSLEEVGRQGCWMVGPWLASLLMCGQALQAGSDS
eukprot:COSAG02_NODE_2476_length_8733_cov_9.786542_1_plen_54_part_10